MAQRGAVSGVLVARETGERLAYGTVAIASLGREQFTDDSGSFFIGSLPAGRLELRVRRLGFHPATLILHVLPDVTDTLRVELQRLAVALERVTVRAWPPCANPGPPDAAHDSTLAFVFEQLRLNAEQFKLLSRSYPYTYKMSRTLTSRLRETGKLSLNYHGVMTLRSDTRREYKPGEVIRRRGRATVFLIPTLAELADDRFVRSHCYHYAGLDKVDSVDMVRIDVIASDSLEGPDVNGAMYLDPQNYQIRRTVFHLSRRDRRTRHIADMRVTTDFGEVMPSIPIIVEVSSVQAMDPEVKGDIIEAYEAQSLLDFAFRGKRPGGG